MRPSLPRYASTWDMDILLNHVKTLDLSEMNLKQLTIKLATLLAICSGQRLQTLQSLDVSNIHFKQDSCTCIIKNLLKTSRPGKHIKPIIFKKHSVSSLCVLSHLEKYIKDTETLRPNKGDMGQLLISFTKPHGPVSRDTIGRWIKSMLHSAGIDSSFTAHSVRSASTSKVAKLGLPMDMILNAANWANAKTFAQFYHRDIESNDCQSFQEAVVHMVTD